MCRILSLAFFLCWMGSWVHAQRIQLNAPLEREVSGDVLGQPVAFGSKFVVYATNPADSGRARLERAMLASPGPVVDLGVSIRLAFHWEHSDADEVPFGLSPDGARVVYLSSIDGTARFELHSTTSDGSAESVRLDAVPPGAGGVMSFRISPDGQWVVYAADQEVAQQCELFAVPIAGGETRKINGPFFADGDVFVTSAGAASNTTYVFNQADYVIGPDSHSVFYRANPEATAVDLFRGSVSGRQPVVRLNTRHLDGQGVLDFQLSPDGGRVVYRADSNVGNRIELFSAPADASSPPVSLHPGLIASADVKEFQLAPGGKVVVYKVNATKANVDELFVARLGQAPRQIESRSVGRFRIDPLGRRVVYMLGFFHGLYSAPLDGSSPTVRIDLDERLDLGTQDFQSSPDGARVVYLEPWISASPASAYSSPIDGSRPPSRFAQLSAFQLGGIIRFGADSRRVVLGLTSYLLDDPAPPLFLGGPEVQGSDVLGIDQVAAGDILLYRCQRSSGELERTDLYRVSIDRRLAPARVNPPFGPGATVDDVVQFEVAADVNRAAYLTRKGEIFGVELDGSPAPIRLNPGDDQDEDRYANLLVSPDGRWVVFVEFGAPFVVPLSGEQAPVALVPNFPLSITPDSRRLLFLVGQPRSYELFGVPLDGSSPPVSLSGSLRLSSDGSILVSPDSSRVVFLAIRGDGSREIHSVASDGSAPPIDLGAHVVDGSLGWVIPFQLQLSPDGRIIVCTGALDSDPAPKLLSIPVDGSGPPVTVDSLSVGVAWLAVDSSSQFLVYAHLSWPGVASLRRVPIHGGATPSSLLPPFEGGYPGVYDLSADGQHILFVSDFEFLPSSFGARYTYDVFSAPVDGSQLRQKLNDLPAGPGWSFAGRHGDLHFGMPLFLGPDGHAVFPEGDNLESIHVDGGSRSIDLTDRDADLVDRVSFGSRGRVAVFELPTAEGSALYAATTDGSRPTRLLSGIPAPGGDVRDVRVTADGSRVVYLGDLDEDGADELFLSFLEQPRHRGTR